MYSTTVFIYQQKTKVLLIDTSGAYFKLRYDPVYAKRLTINKGVDNVILFEFINQDEKPVNITGSGLVFRVVNQAGDALLIEKTMEIINAQFGRAKVTLTSQDVVDIQAQPAGYSIQRASGNLVEAVFTDAAAGARAPIDIVDSVFPEFMPSEPVIIPTVNLSAQGSYGPYDASPGQWPDWALGQQFGGGGIGTPYQITEWYSSHMAPQGPVTTIQMDLIHYTGTIKVQGAEDYQGIWYNATESRTYLNETGTIYFNVLGYHPLLRLAFNNSLATTSSQPGIPATANAIVVNGVITSITVTNAGQGYLAPPNVTIIGSGAGAIATAQIGNGQVGTITVENGGSGYRPWLPGSSAAFVAINTGYPVNIFYR